MQLRPRFLSIHVLCLEYVFHLLHVLLVVSLAASSDGRHAVRLAAWSVGSKASCSQESRYKTPLMKKVGVPCTPLRSPPSTSSSMRARPRRSAMSRVYCCISRPP